MYLLGIKFPKDIRKMTMNLQKLLRLRSLILVVLCQFFAVFFEQKSICLVGGQGQAKFFNWGHYPHATPGFVAQR